MVRSYRRFDRYSAFMFMLRQSNNMALKRNKMQKNTSNRRILLTKGYSVTKSINLHVRENL